MLYSEIPNLILIFAITALAFWRNDGILYVVAGLLFVVFGFTLWDNSNYISIGAVVAGIGIGLRPFIKKKDE